jgi:hypothetical protein
LKIKIENQIISKYIRNLAEDKDLNLASNPINPETNDLFTRCSDGLLICKAINFSAPNTIDEKSLNRGNQAILFKHLENIELALRSAESIGCHVINIRPIDITQGKEDLILGLLWQIIKVGVSFYNINFYSKKNIFN